MASKPRNDSMHTDIAVRIVPALNWVLSNTGSQEKPCPAPDANASTAASTKTARTASALVNAMVFTRRVDLIPARLMAALTTTNVTIHTHTGADDTTAAIDTAATSDNS